MNIPRTSFGTGWMRCRPTSACLVCGTGARSYECQVLLNQKGFGNVCNVQGGHAMILAVAPDFIDFC